MHDVTAPSRDGAGPFTLREAAAVLGISLNTLRRRIASGQIQAEQVQRPQGFVWQVYVDGVAPQEDGADGTVQQDRPGTVPQDGAGTVLHPPTAIMQAEAMAAYTRSILEPLVRLVAEQEGTIRAQAETIGTLNERAAGLERENGRQAAQLLAQAQTIERLTAPAPPERPGAPESEPEVPESRIPPSSPFPAPIEPSKNATPWWQRWRSWLAAGLIVAVVGSVSCQAKTSPTYHLLGCQRAMYSFDFIVKNLTEHGATLDINDLDGTLVNLLAIAEKSC